MNPIKKLVKGLLLIPFNLNPANSRIFLMFKLIATAAGAYIPDDINSMVTFKKQGRR